MAMRVVHTPRSLVNAYLQDWLEDSPLPLMTDEEQLMTNQNEGMTDQRKDRRTTRHQPGEKVQDNIQRTFFLLYVF